MRHFNLKKKNFHISSSLNSLLSYVLFRPFWDNTKSNRLTIPESKCVPKMRLS